MNLKPLSLKDINSKLINKNPDSEFYTLPFQTVRNGNGIFKLTGKQTISVESFQDLLPAILTGKCHTLEELYYATQFREIPTPIDIDDPIFMANLIINKAYTYVEDPSQSIFCNESLIAEAKRIAYDRINKSHGLFNIDIKDADLERCINSLVSFADEDYIDEFGNKCTNSWFTKNSFIKSIKAIQVSIEEDPSRLKIFIGSPGTGKSYQGIHSMGDTKTLVVSLSNVVAAHIVSRAAAEGFEDYEFWSYSKARYMLSINPNALDSYEGFILEESSMLSCTELNIVLQILNTNKPVCILGDNAQLPGFLGVGNLLHALVNHFPDRVTELTVNYRARLNPDIVKVFTSFKETARLMDTSQMQSIITTDARMSTDNKAIAAWLEDVRSECDSFACAFRNDDVISLNNMVLSTVFNTKNLLKPKNDLYASKLEVFSELLLKGKPFEVISTKNIKTQKQFKAFNGERFIASAVGDKFIVTSHQFTKHKFTVSIKQLALNFDLGYAMTVHKLQGSEATSVLYYEPRLSNIINPANLRYVGLSRAKCKLYIAVSRLNHPKFNQYNDIITEANYF